MENQVISQTDLKALAEAYLEAFHARDLDRCMEFFTDDSTVDLNMTWRVKALSGRVTIRFENGKIKNGKLSPRMTNPFNMIREDMGAW
jgi:ketosteroid isomerase-like protein